MSKQLCINQSNLHVIIRQVLIVFLVSSILFMSLLILLNQLTLSRTPKVKVWISFGETFNVFLIFIAQILSNVLLQSILCMQYNQVKNLICLGLIFMKEIDA